MDDIALKYLAEWRNDWCAFASDVLRANLDEEQKAVLRSVQTNPMTVGSVRRCTRERLCFRLCRLMLHVFNPGMGRRRKFNPQYKDSNDCTNS